ncbi:uncharacterized protein EV420DRAFT_1705965 [Desarmillaria tabescens]|uniref:Uncharacterized protein n=1 Tax=Armillaria tabescens TaxID=1929756 RepID=A0AA39JX34_ARMTA|nr:uncharacterized protein EV420DRAFT_1705965 [Desarmillaria tabescens]KAK0450368.1 hypothetical protein EV420DRAFT_1705965 [Desarmillaria tabescens]
MGVHFYDRSPSGPDEQYARLGPPRSLLKAGIPCVVWAEDALSIIHRVPTVLFDQQLLVPDNYVKVAAQVICSDLPYSIRSTDNDERWKDFSRFNKDRPHAFDLNTSTIFLQHDDPALAHETNKPVRIFVHAASVFHFDVQDPSRSCMNPSPPSEDSSSIRFPTLPAFYDAIVDTKHDPPLPFIHQKFEASLASFQSYLTMYTLSDKGITSVKNPAGDGRVLIPACLELLQKIKDENRPFLIRHFLSLKPLECHESEMERMVIKEERFLRIDIPYQRPSHPLPYHPFYRSRGWDLPAQEPRLTPYLIRNPSRKLDLDWRPLAKYASMARKMMSR